MNEEIFKDLTLEEKQAIAEYCTPAFLSAIKKAVKNIATYETLLALNEVHNGMPNEYAANIFRQLKSKAEGRASLVAIIEASAQQLTPKEKREPTTVKVNTKNNAKGNPLAGF